MKKSKAWFAVISVLAGGFLFVSFFLDKPSIQVAGAEILLWAERLLAALLFFAIADAAILQIRKVGDDSGMRIVRTAGFAVFLAVLLLGLIKGPEAEDFNQIVYFIQNVLESALAGIVCLSLIFAMYRLPSQSPSALKAGFFVGLIVFLVIYSGIPQMFDLSDAAVSLIEWIEAIPQGVLTGLLLGIALGGELTGIRFILSGKIPSKGDK